MEKITYQVLMAGDRAVTVEFGRTIDIRLNYLARSFAGAIERKGLAGLGPAVVAYASVLLYYDPMRFTYGDMLHLVDDVMRDLELISENEKKEFIEIPVFYGAPGSDIEEIADYEGLTVPEVIARHTQSEYYVFLLGFAPGYAYIASPEGGLTVPRLKTPKMRPFVGAVSVCGNQTIVGSGKPGMGGWHVIGRTPVRPFVPEREDPFLFHPGQWVRFFEISEEEFNDYSRREFAK